MEDSRPLSPDRSARRIRGRSTTPGPPRSARRMPPSPVDTAVDRTLGSGPGQEVGGEGTDRLDCMTDPNRSASRRISRIDSRSGLGLARTARTRPRPPAPCPTTSSISCTTPTPRRPGSGSIPSTRSPPSQGPVRARYLLAKLLERAHQKNLGVPPTITTPYVNSIPPDDEPLFPGDEHLERRIRRFIRWNAAVMVVKANHREKGIGGHLSTFASSATLHEVGFNHFFRGKADGRPGRPHLLPGPCRARHLRPGLSRRDGSTTSTSTTSGSRSAGHGLSSYPHPRLMPDFWEYPTVSMGLGPDQFHLSRPLQSLPPQPRDRRHLRLEGVVLPRRRRGRRARNPWRHLPGQPREARQPDLGDQLQPPAARRAGARQRQDHSGARVGVPRRRLERDQGHLGQRLGSTPGRRPRGRSRAGDERHRRRRVPALQGRRWRLCPRALLRKGPAGAGTRQGLDRRARSGRCDEGASTIARSTPPTTWRPS